MALRICDHRIGQIANDIASLRQEGLATLWRGVLFLALCMLGSRILGEPKFLPDIVARFLDEGLGLLQEIFDSDRLVTKETGGPGNAGWELSPEIACGCPAGTRQLQLVFHKTSGGDATFFDHARLDLGGVLPGGSGSGAFEFVVYQLSPTLAAASLDARGVGRRIQI